MPVDPNLKLLARLGRPGIALVTLAAGAVAAFGGWLVSFMGPWNGEPVWSPRLVLAGGVAAILGALFFLRGLFRLVRYVPPPPALPPLDAAGVARAARAAMPCFVCVTCRRVWTRLECAGECPQCESRADCLEVRDDADLGLVRAAIEP